MPPTIIGIAGNMGTGKTTIATMIQSYYPNSVILPFAGEVKKELHTLLSSYRKGHFFSYTANMLYGSQEDKNLIFFVPASLFAEAASQGISLTDIGDEQFIHGQTWYTTTGRKLMQWYATDYRRKLTPSYWLNKWQHSAERAMGGGWNIIVDDIRFPNEAELVRSLGGYIIKVLRDTNHDLTHHSECLVSSITSHYDIDNFYSLDYLDSRTFNIASFILPSGELHDPRAGTQTMAD